MCHQDIFGMAEMDCLLMENKCNPKCFSDEHVCLIQLPDELKSTKRTLMLLYRKGFKVPLQIFLNLVKQTDVWHLK